VYSPSTVHHHRILSSLSSWSWVCPIASHSMTYSLISCAVLNGVIREIHGLSCKAFLTDRFFLFAFLYKVGAMFCWRSSMDPWRLLELGHISIPYCYLCWCGEKVLVSTIDRQIKVIPTSMPYPCASTETIAILVSEPLQSIQGADVQFMNLFIH